MVISSEQEQLVKELAEKIKKSTCKYIENRKITKKDMESLGDYEFIETINNEIGLYVTARRKYEVELESGIPVLVFKDNIYIVDDELLGEHPIEWNAKECAEYVNGLIGY